MRLLCGFLCAAQLTLHQLWRFPSNPQTAAGPNRQRTHGMRTAITCTLYWLVVQCIRYCTAPDPGPAVVPALLQAPGVQRQQRHKCGDLQQVVQKHGQGGTYCTGVDERGKE